MKINPNSSDIPKKWHSHPVVSSIMNEICCSQPLTWSIHRQKAIVSHFQRNFNRKWNTYSNFDKILISGQNHVSVIGQSQATSRLHQAYYSFPHKITLVKLTLTDLNLVISQGQFYPQLFEWTRKNGEFM